MMYSSISFRTGEPSSLVGEFIEMFKTRRPRFTVADLENPQKLLDANILAVHFAAGGAQGDPGAVEILYRQGDGIQILYGNYVYENLDVDAVFQKIPVLRCFDSSRGCLPYPFGGQFNIPEDWKYVYMGAMNHFLCRTEIFEKALPFLEALLENVGDRSQVFCALAWFCGAE